VFYHPDQAAEVAKVKSFYESATVSLLDQGAYFSRPYGAVVDEVYRRNAETTAALRKMKRIFDPNNVMNVGKLCF
jgi:FAD/FMN-containing dehydrogenase